MSDRNLLAEIIALGILLICSFFQFGFLFTIYLNIANYISFFLVATSFYVMSFFAFRYIDLLFVYNKERIKGKNEF
jgi:hypothetical protein